MKFFSAAVIVGLVMSTLTYKPLSVSIYKSLTLDSLGACQGISFQNGKYFLYGDREVGVMRAYTLKGDSLRYDHNEYRFTIKGENIIKHPTGIAFKKGMPTFIGNSVRQNAAGTSWKAVIYAIDWSGFLKTKTLDGHLLKTIADDACIQGARPEYVKHKGKWFMATADYGNKANEVRLYDAAKLAKADKTSEKGLLYKKFNCSPWVQNLHFIENKGILVLIQNQVEGRKWRLTFLDLDKSITNGKGEVIKVIDTDKADELEGFTLTDNPRKGIAVSSSRKNNVSLVNINWSSN
ncbi:hypothetical protein GJU39_22020 [Pedobacter petrophilus]|uniref:Esterase-like activity of phytase family protein n=1 Tax=Pedobacter petrophilus TaxID=1908241 RepID=A0A7K0G4M8_9SPHI|nr:hypothetical protein [Pedobacter petrophilus]MRX78758.1 hypothetical protein [Pedobacter petrophilus]